MKTYNILLSREFPVTHPKAGQETGFKPKVLAAINGLPCYRKKRFEEVDRGEAVINLRQWTGRPYRSKTVLIKTLTYEDGIGIQKLEFGVGSHLFEKPIIDGFYRYAASYTMLAANDGLSLDDWQAWFKGYDKTKPLAIIHFTDFRYE